MILTVLASLVITFFLGSLVLGWIFSAPVYKGPVSDHFDGRKFVNPGDIKEHGMRDLFKWFRTRERGNWTVIRENTVHGIPPHRVEGDSIHVLFINHSTFLIQTRGLNILTDPVWSERASPVSFAGPKRMRPPGIIYNELPDIDIVLLTHNHYDHFDIRTLERLAQDSQPVFYVPLGAGKYLLKKGIGNVREMDWWDEIIIGKDVKLLCTRAQHFSGRGMFDRNKTLWCGFALISGSGSIYYSGDTGYGPFFEDIAARIPPIRLAFLPIGAFRPEWFMAPIHTSPSDALKIHREIRAKTSIAMHYGTFPLADDAMNEPAALLRELTEQEGLSTGEFIIMQEGEGITFP